MFLTHIREHRLRMHMTQEELAKIVNVRRETIVHLENGRYNPSLRLTMDIARVLGVTVETLFEFTNEE